MRDRQPEILTESYFKSFSEYEALGSPAEDNNKLSKVFKNKLVMKEMELKLVAEIKERADQKGKNPKASPLETALAVNSISLDPVAQLVTELSQSLNLEKDPSTTTRKNLTTNNKPPAESNGITFVSQLKKIEPKKLTTKDKAQQEDASMIIDFKSRLRKVEKNEDDNDNLEGNRRESTASSDSGNLKLEDLDDKRKSTGSISSLKKLWEPKDSVENSGNIQLSPKLCIKNKTAEDITEISPTDTSDDSVKQEKIVYKGEKKVWPPINEEKPLIPTKPPVKALKPIINRPAGSAIYATPTNATTKPPIMAKPTNLETKTPEEETKLPTGSDNKTGRETILEISQALESTLNSIKSNTSVSTATWLQLSDKIGLLHGSCMDYADNVVPAHTKFHFRELLTRLGNQAEQLRSAGSRNTTENVKCISEVNNTIKDVVNVVFR